MITVTDASVVIDNGSGNVKAGIAGEDSPSCIFPSIIGRPKYEKTMGAKNGDCSEIYIGDQTNSRRGILTLKYPIDHGIITSWDDMELLWNYTFNEQLQIDPKTHNIMLTEAPQNPKKNREKMMEIMFEKFQTNASYVAIQGVLSLYASGRTTGLVLDIGDGVAHTIPIFDGYCIPYTVSRQDFAGRDITVYLKKLLEEKGHRFVTTSEREIVRCIKEKFSYCALDYHNELELFKKRNMTRNYKLPDGNIIKINEEMFGCCEALFDPSLIGSELKGIHQTVTETIQKSDIDIRKDMYSNIVLSGGTTITKGLKERLDKELNILKPPKCCQIKINAPNERQYSVWLGGSILASLESFQNAWIYKSEYNESGVRVVHQKCM
jgi:actin